MASSPNQINANLARIMRRKGVAADSPPSLERWADFLGALDACLSDYEKNRELLDASAKLSSAQLRELYDQLRNESELRLADSERYQRKLELDVQSRTADLSAAQDELREINARLEYDATHDSVTGVYNRAYWIRELERRFEECQAAQSSGDIESCRLVVFYVDFDKFKRINDSHGHETGDRILVAAVERLQRVLSPGDCLARLGGDEFTILSNLAPDHSEAALAAQIVAQFETPFDCDGLLVPLEASVGAAAAGSHHSSAGEVLRDADIAMYRAKNKRSSFVVFDKALFQAVQESIELERGLASAIAERQFFVNFEPVIDIATGTICGTESLARWEHPERGVLRPARFIPVAEERNSMATIDRIVFEETCIALQGWADLSLTTNTYRVHVNLSGSQLERTDTVGYLQSTIGKYGIDSSQIALEILETYLVEDSGQASRNVRELSDLGFAIFIDDFGTGYSSLSYLAKYPIDGIKIDRSFVRDVDSKPSNHELIRSIVAMAGALNVQVVVEGVETLEQLALVRELGCHLIQGYVFTQPLCGGCTSDFLGASPHLEIIEAL